MRSARSTPSAFPAKFDHTKRKTKSEHALLVYVNMVQSDIGWLYSTDVEVLPFCPTTGACYNLLLSPPVPETLEAFPFVTIIRPRTWGKVQMLKFAQHQDAFV